MDFKLHIFKEFIPTVVKILLSRTKGLHHVEYMNVITCLEAALTAISGHFGSDDVSA